MERLHTSIAQLVGNTPLLEVTNYEQNNGIKAHIIAKLEYLNPSGSVKDRIALSMIEDAEKNGTLKPGATIIEPTSGNTGIGIAAIAAAKGYQSIVVMPESMSIERRKLLQAYGAKLVLTEDLRGMNGAIRKAEELNQSIKGSIILSQFTNQANPEIHKKTTGPEIWNDLKGNVDIFVAGIGTGGTITGVGQFLKEKNRDIQVVAVEPKESPVLSGGRPGPHKIQGIGAGFVPKTLDTNIYDDIILVDSEEAFRAGREVAASDGLLVGISSGAALYAATKLAERPENEGKTIVALLPDSGERYLSTALFERKE